MLDNGVEMKQQNSGGTLDQHLVTKVLKITTKYKFFGTTSIIQQNDLNNAIQSEFNYTYIKQNPLNVKLIKITAKCPKK